MECPCSTPLLHSVSRLTCPCLVKLKVGLQKLGTHHINHTIPRLHKPNIFLTEISVLEMLHLWLDLCLLVWAVIFPHQDAAQCSGIEKVGHSFWVLLSLECWLSPSHWVAGFLILKVRIWPNYLNLRSLVFTMLCAVRRHVHMRYSMDRIPSPEMPTVSLSFEGAKIQQGKCRTGKAEWNSIPEGKSHKSTHFLLPYCFSLELVYK